MAGDGAGQGDDALAAIDAGRRPRAGQPADEVAAESEYDAWSDEEELSSIEENPPPRPLKRHRSEPVPPASLPATPSIPRVPLLRHAYSPSNRGGSVVHTFEEFWKEWRVHSVNHKYAFADLVSRGIIVLSL